jgi:hypothetical protein
LEDLISLSFHPKKHSANNPMRHSCSNKGLKHGKFCALVTTLGLWGNQIHFFLPADSSQLSMPSVALCLTIQHELGLYFDLLAHHNTLFMLHQQASIAHDSAVQAVHSDQNPAWEGSPDNKLSNGCFEVLLLHTLLLQSMGGAVCM